MLDAGTERKGREWWNAGPRCTEPPGPLNPDQRLALQSESLEVQRRARQYAFEFFRQATTLRLPRTQSFLLLWLPGMEPGKPARIHSLAQWDLVVRDYAHLTNSPIPPLTKVGLQIIAEPDGKPSPVGPTKTHGWDELRGEYKVREVSHRGSAPIPGTGDTKLGPTFKPRRTSDKVRRINNGGTE